MPAQLPDQGFHWRIWNDCKQSIRQPGAGCRPTLRYGSCRPGRLLAGIGLAHNARRCRRPGRPPCRPACRLTCRRGIKLRSRCRFHPGGAARTTAARLPSPATVGRLRMHHQPGRRSIFRPAAHERRRRARRRHGPGRQPGHPHPALPPAVGKGRAAWPGAGGLAPERRAPGRPAPAPDRRDCRPAPPMPRRGAGHASHPPPQPPRPTGADDDLGKTWSTPPLADVADFYNERRWLGWDLLCGKVDRGHPLWPWLLRAGARPQELLWFAQHRCPPDLIGVNYYITSERWLDHDPARFPGLRADTVCGRPCVDVEAVRAMPEPPPGIGPLLEEVWQRYGLPIAVTEAHLDAGREDQLRWLTEIWQSAEAVRARGVDLRAVTAWSLLGAFDWNSLVTRQDGYYESGAFDTRFSPPRATAVARLLQQLAASATAHAHTHATPAATVGPVAEGAAMEAAAEPQPYRHPAAGGRGWWRRPGRLTLQRERLEVAPPFDAVDEGPPILISGASGTLGRAFARI